MSSRGWILQEKILSPAVLHFGEEEMHWECRHSTASETWATMRVGGSGLLKNILHEAHRQGCELHPQGHFIAWYMILGIYSQTSLTNVLDRLPAILGLAQRFEGLFRTTFLAGLWFEDLHRGLLWSKYETREDPTATHRYIQQNHETVDTKDRVNRITAPSWSWICSYAKFTFEWCTDSTSLFPIHPVDRLISATDVEIVDVAIKPCPHIHRGAISGKLELWGVITKILAVPSPDREIWTVKQPIYPRIKNSRKTTSCDPHLSPSHDKLECPELTCVMDFDLLQPLECYCLIIADWRFEESDKEGFSTSFHDSPPELRSFLILRRKRPLRKHHHLLDYGVFERIGMGAGNIHDVERFFGSSSLTKRFFTIV
jgi:hypothetical protein